MILTVYPSLCLKGDVQLPSSKSYSIRAALIAACGGKSTIANFSDCDDALVSLRAAKALGAKVVSRGKTTFRIVGSRPPVSIPSTINVQESGTVLRFILPLLSLRGQKTIVQGKGTLVGRPNLFLTQTLRGMGVDIKGTGEKEGVPIHIQGGDLRGGKISIRGDLSSQFISALLITCPRLREDTCLKLTGNRLVSSDYITMTLDVLKQSGVKIKQKSLREFFVEGNQTFRGLKNFIVPSDYGLAAFLLAAAVLTPSQIVLNGNLKEDLGQADGQILVFLKKMGVHFSKTKASVKIRGPFSLKGGNFSLKNCPDLVPIMTVLALFAKKPTRLYDIEHARAKESDRISDLKNELLKIGANIEEASGELRIYPQPQYKKNCLLDPHHDHRLAMAFCVLGLKVGARVKDIECTSKSYPSFVRDFKALGAKVK